VIVRAGCLASAAIFLVSCGGGGGSGAPAAPAVVAPGAPTIGTLEPGDRTLTVNFTPPTANGGAPVGSYTATCTAGGDSRTGTGAGSPIAVTGLVNGIAYACSVTATNTAGSSPPSASVSGTPAPQPKPLEVTPVLGGFTAGATVDLFRADNGERLDSRTTSADGVATVTVPASYTGFAIVRVTGDAAVSYLDERTDTLRPFPAGQRLFAVVPPGSMREQRTPIAVTTVTHAIALNAGITASATATAIAAPGLDAAALQAAQARVLDAIGLPASAFDPLKVPLHLKAADQGKGRRLEGSGEALNHGVMLITLARLTPAAVDLVAFSQTFGTAVRDGTLGTEVPQVAELPQQFAATRSSHVASGSQGQVTTVPEPILVKTSPGPGGMVSPASVSVRKGATAKFALIAATGYEVMGATGCGGSLSGSEYTTGVLSEACTVSATFRLKRYTVTATAGAGGTISPASVSVEHGVRAAFTLTPSAGFAVAAVSGCAGSLSGNTYTTGPITGSCEVAASFIEVFTVTATAGAGGSISPGSALVNRGSSTAFTVTPTSTYDIAAVTGCGGTLSGSTYTTAAVTESCTVSATFRLKRYTVTATAGAGGTISPASVSVEHGSTTALTVTPQSDHIISSVTGCGGTLSGNTYTTAAVTASCTVNAAFLQKVPMTAIAGRWTGTDGSRPAYISVSSAADDSFLKVVPIGADGSFSVTGLVAGRQYLVEPEQAGTRVIAARSVATQAAGRDVAMYRAASATAEQGFSTASPGDYITFEGARVAGLSDGEFVYRWEGNPSASGAEHSSYVPKPLMIEPIAKATVVAEPQAAIRLAEEYGIVLVDPDPGAPANRLPWTSEYADRLLQSIRTTPLKTATQGARASIAVTYVELVGDELENDLRRVSGDAYLGGRIQIGASAFTYATPLLARIEGRRGIFFSNRLFRVVLRMVTEDGRRRDLVAEMMKTRYGITVATRDDDALLIAPVTCPQVPSDCLDSEWKVFNPDEFFELLSILEEFPDGLRDFSQPGKPIGLRHLLRRRDGIPHPLYPQAGAVAWPENGYAEFMESGLRGARSSRHALIVHEKAHFVWAGLLTPQQRYDWLRLSGWYRVPQLVAGQDVRAVGRCDQWQSDPKAWNPPNVTDADVGFMGVVRHDQQGSDTATIKRDWASCSTTQFVSVYAATINPNEDFAESFASFLLNPDLLRSRALPKYEFIRDRLMQGSIYISRIRQDLTFEVFNLYPDYTYPGKIKSVDVRVTGGPRADKRVVVRIVLQTSEGCDSARNSGCFDGASGASLRLFSRLDPPTFRDMSLSPVTPKGDVLEGSITMSRLAANGWWQVETISVQDKVGNVRISKQSSKDFGWKLYIDNPGEDLTKPAYVPGSISLRLVAPGDPLASSAISGDERELVTQYRFKETDASGCYVRTAYADTFGDPARRIYKGSFDDWGVVERLAAGQPDGATHLCTVRHRVTRFWTSGTYSTVFVYLADEAGNMSTTNFSQDGRDPNLERAPSLRITGANSDGTPPTLDITPCKTTDEGERCLRIKAVPTNPAAPNGETQVDIFYWAWEEPPLTNASGLDGGTIVLRDPLGKTFFFYLNESVGVVNRRPLRRIDGNFYFACPTVGAPSSCDATTPVQYQMRVILPIGSAPGVWGLQEMSVYDKVSNTRGYDFTETFRFTPAEGGSVDGKHRGYTFTVGAAATDTDMASRSAGAMDVLSRSARKVWGSVVDVGEAIVARIVGMIAELRGWMQGAPVAARVVASAPVGAHVAVPVVDDAGRASRGDRAESADLAQVVSSSVDPLTGSRYQILRRQARRSVDLQAWQLEYRSNTDLLYGAAELPTTADVLWRGGSGTDRLPTSAWTRVCSDKVWAVQDGYQLLFGIADRSLIAVHPGQLWVAEQAETTVVSDVRCTFAGGARIEGYALRVDDREPSLRREPVPALRFGFALDRHGGVVRREVTATTFSWPQYCATSANEALMACGEARRALRW